MKEAKGNPREKVVAPRKDIVASMASDFKKVLGDAIAEKIDKLVIDLDGVETVDSAGIGVIVSAYNSMKKAGGSISITNVNPDTYKLFKAMRLDEHFDIGSMNQSNPFAV